MSEEVKKLTEEEITQIKEMQTQYNKFVFELGSVEAQLSEVATHRIAMETEKSNILGDIKSLTVREKELLTSLQEKYGVGNINIETGEITPF
jgi:septal ring factor EnvC (AmiA/AmiB activator)